MLALLIAVATALTFSTATPMTPPASSQGESFCLVPEAHDTPFISKQETAERTAPRGEAQGLTGPCVGELPLVELLALGTQVFPPLYISIPIRPIDGIYPRGPPTIA